MNNLPTSLFEAISVPHGQKETTLKYVAVKLRLFSMVNVYKKIILKVIILVVIQNSSILIGFSAFSEYLNVAYSNGFKC